MKTDIGSLIGGAGVFWDLGNQTDPYKLKAGLDSVGASDMELPARTYRAALKSAMSDEFAGRGKLVRGVKDQNAYTLIVESKEDVDLNKYGTEATAHVNESNGQVRVSAHFEQYGDKLKVSVGEGGDAIWSEKDGQSWNLYSGFVNSDGEKLAGDLGKLAEKLGPKVRWFKLMLPAETVSKVLVKFVTDEIGGVCLKPNGGLYHIPQDGVSRWNKLQQAVEAAAVGGQRNVFTQLGLQLTDQTVMDMKRIVTEQLGRECGEIMDEIQQQQRNVEGYLERRQERLRRIRQKAESYSDVLGQTLETLGVLLKSAEGMAGMVAAEQEGDAFEELMEIEL